MATPLKVKFWGTRGSIAVPGSNTVRYGGNTSCVEIRYGDQVLICDCGTGLRELGQSLVAENPGKPFNGSIFVTHTHWDHIQGFPFFVPSYLPDSQVAIYSAKSVGDSFENIFRGQMGIQYFPVEIGDMAGNLEFRQIDGHPFEVGPVRVKTIFTNHPGVDAAYRFEFDGGRSVIYLTDHENHQAYSGPEDLAIRCDKQIEEFCEGADLLIVDSQYTEEEYEKKRGWGHSRWTDSVALGAAAHAKRVALFHHEPTRSDDQLDEIESSARALMKEKAPDTECFCSKEGQEIQL